MDAIEEINYRQVRSVLFVRSSVDAMSDNDLGWWNHLQRSAGDLLQWLVEVHAGNPYRKDFQVKIVELVSGCVGQGMGDAG